MDEKKTQEVNELLDIMESRFEARQAEAKAKLESDAVAEKAKKFDLLEEDYADFKTWKEAKGGFSIKKETELGFDEKEEGREFMHYVKTGDEIVARKALQEGTGSEGGYVVPDDFGNQLYEKRDALSWVRRAGLNVIQTSRDKIDLPAEATSFTKFTRVAEEASFTTNDPSINQNQVIVEKYTKLFKVSEELLDDNAVNLESHFVNMIGRSYAETEAYQVAVGSGSNEHEGIFTGGDTDALTFDSAGNITPDEIYELLYTLGAGYRGNAFWLMNSQTWRYLLSMRDSNNWVFGNADMATVGAGGSQPDGTLISKPVFLQDDIDTIGTGVTTVMVGDPYYYALVERKGLEIKRLNELYAETGQIGFRCMFRQGGKVLVEEAFAGGLQA